ncbi:MAG: hypothetical protein KGS61_21745, partial [Verrucomicrobia bacterium]|nr:hypothetical protein [Verrucomicrobiota bacterium]
SVPMGVPHPVSISSKGGFADGAGFTLSNCTERPLVITKLSTDKWGAFSFHGWRLLPNESRDVDFRPHDGTWPYDHHIIGPMPDPDLTNRLKGTWRLYFRIKQSWSHSVVYSTNLVVK